MIIWIILFVILVIAGVTVIALSGGDSADSSTPQYPATDPPITFSSNRASVPSGGANVIITVSYPSGMSGTVGDGRSTTWSPLWSDTLTIFVTQTTTFTLSVFDAYKTYTRPITITVN
jgi:hypothetical protein